MTLARLFRFKAGPLPHFQAISRLKQRRKNSLKSQARDEEK